MASVSVIFSFRPGLRSHPFANVRLGGSWNDQGEFAADWTFTAMASGLDPDGLPAFETSVTFDATAVGTGFQWGVKLDCATGTDLWAITTEIDDENTIERTRSFVLGNAGQTEIYYLTRCGRLGANKKAAGARFALWAPNAREVDLILADPATGYVANDGTGIITAMPMTAQGDETWCVELPDFGAVFGQPYMYRVTKYDGTVAFRTDIYSRKQIGLGNFDPVGQPYSGTPDNLDGPQSCSVVCDPTIIAGRDSAEFWHDEFSAEHPLPLHLDDLVIYELHVGALGYGNAVPGTLDDAIGFIDHLAALGINAVELLPIAEFDGTTSWGYGTSHFFAVDEAAGGTDLLKQFVLACHRRGIAVILDVCYNHFDPNAERAEWAYDSDDPARNIYFWYEGSPSDYADSTGGYIDNVSSGWAPRFDQEMVRQLFISSAVSFMLDCHIDGFRVDQTSSIYQYPAIHANGQPATRAAAFGAKFLRQWTRTMRLLKPGIFLTAEDYSGSSSVTAPSLTGNGLGFDACWYSDFHHNLIEFAGGSYGELLRNAGYGDNRPLSMDFFAGALGASGSAKIVYSACHDDCGNRPGSARPIVTAVNSAALSGDTRVWAEARIRVVAGLTLLSAGTPMFFMGEEIGAAKFYRYNDFMANREDILGDTSGKGANLFAWYRDLIAFKKAHSAVGSRNIDVGWTDDANRVIAFHRWDDNEEILVIGSLANASFLSGYTLRTDRLGDAGWTEIFNSDAAVFGGWNIGNSGRTIHAAGGALTIIIPASGVLVFQRGSCR